MAFSKQLSMCKVIELLIAVSFIGPTCLASFIYSKESISLSLLFLVSPRVMSILIHRYVFCINYLFNLLEDKEQQSVVFSL